MRVIWAVKPGLQGNGTKRTCLEAALVCQATCLSLGEEKSDENTVGGTTSPPAALTLCSCLFHDCYEDSNLKIIQPKSGKVRIQTQVHLNEKSWHDYCLENQTLEHWFSTTAQGAIVLLRGHMAMAGDIFSYQFGGMLLKPGG